MKTPTFTVRRAVHLLDQLYWVQIPEQQLYRLLQAQRLVRKTEHGYQVTNPQHYRGRLRTRTGHHTRRLENGSLIQQPHTTIEITADGIKWLAGWINQHQQKTA